MIDLASLHSKSRMYKNLPRWGRWWLDTAMPVSLNIRLAPHYVYELPLARCQTDLDRQGWLNHMAEKSLLVDHRDLVMLALAFRDLLASHILGSSIKNKRYN